jgi:hypothetical protein
MTDCQIPSKGGSSQSSMAALAHLANFAYDPVNYDHFEALNIVELFLDILTL